MDVKEIREALNKWQVTEPTSQELSTLRADNYDFSFVTFYAGYQAALSAIDPEAIRREEQKKYAKVFNWLLGIDGDFPPSEPGRRYSWRGELKTRLAAILQSSPADQGQKELS